MGLAQAALELGHEVIVVSGPVNISYPEGAKIEWITSTEELLERCVKLFPECDGAIGAAAPCDYRPVKVAETKISKTGGPLVLELIETPDVMAELGKHKRDDQWLVGFALETDDQRFKALTKMQKKSCDLMVLNGPAAMDALENDVELLNPQGELLARLMGSKQDVTRGILKIVQERLIKA